MNDNTPLPAAMLTCEPRRKSITRARVRKANTRRVLRRHPKAQVKADAHLILPLSIAIIGVVSIAATLAGL